MSLNEQLCANKNIARRSASRLRLHLPGQIILVGGRSQCLIENVSVTGAQIMAENPPLIGRTGVLRCEHIEVYFTVIWGAGNLVGVEFDETLSLQDVLELRRINDTYSEVKCAEVRSQARRWVSGELG